VFEEIIKDPATPYTRRYTTLSNVTVKKLDDNVKEMSSLTINLNLI